MTMIILDTNVISEILKKDHADRRVIGLVHPCSDE